ncbi:GTP cyclohydrolase I FolE [Salinibacterium sp. SWN248]|uniref:GTP cyclohydrolase I FolE n=1 Tax=Salinibacterium sp. SWN248 TaxID=2792056 RepID=UPI0018CDD7E7|nr:GTP cyclohydrolase I FolE [Salinibacterium sp. SWN248]MBH0023113.1 GTP cyclohydrolase I FolE [Salinibacterium sp. SWN248]
MSIDLARIEAAVAEILDAVGEDPKRAGLTATPRRVAEAYSEFFAGNTIDPLVHLSDSIEFTAKADQTGELVLVRDIEFRSMCEHHLLPFLGVAHVAYVPDERIIGLGNIARVVETIAARAQLQERLTEEITDAINTGLSPRGVLVVIDAVHGCVSARGPRQTASSTVTLASRGVLSDPVERAEVMALIGRGGDA